MGSILNYILIATQIFHHQIDEDLTAAWISKVYFIFIVKVQSSFVLLYLISKFTKILDASTKLSELAGYSTRLGELLDEIEAIKSEAFYSPKMVVR